MDLPNYTVARASRISKRVILNIEQPIHIKILWARVIESHQPVNKSFHKHSFFEAHFIFRGMMVYDTKSSEHELTSGKVIIIPPETEHKISEFSDDIFRVSIAFSMPASEANIYDDFFDERVFDDFDRILAEADHRDGLSDIIIRDRFLSMLSEYIRHIHISSESERSAEGEDIRVSLIKRYINDNKNVFLDSDDVARYCHFNAKYINRIFKRETGQTLLEYIHDVKSSEAERLLSETDLTIEQIGEQLGFSNVQYFNTFFKRRTSMTPGYYRKLAQKK